MSTVENLIEKVRTLNPTLQLEALHYVHYLSVRQSGEDVEGSRLSLAMALRGTEDEVWPDYQDADYLEKWQ